LIDDPERSGYGMDAQWIDEFHHALRVATGGERQGYYEDFDGPGHLAKSFRDAYVYDGQYSPHRKRKFGSKTEGKGQQFIVFSQNHDQVGNRMLGERTSILSGFEKCKLMAGAVLCSPFLPMLFMGEEWFETHPFLYFVDHTDPQLIEAVRQGRSREFEAFHNGGDAPDPFSEETFLESELQWQLTSQEPHATMLRYYKALIDLRKQHAVLRFPDRHRISVTCDDNGLISLKRWNDTTQVICLMNFSEKQNAAPLPEASQVWKKLIASSDPCWLGAAEAPEFLGKDQQPDVQPWSILVYENVL
jgi:maltooligosyltrehalose trehalohydrolase